MAPRVAIVLLTLLLASCSTTQPSLYAPKADGEGYSDESLGKGLFKVTFEGNEVTSRALTEDYALYRAAQLTLNLGYDHFAVRDKLTERNTTVTRDNYDPFLYPYYGPYRYRYPYYGYRPPTYRWEYTTYKTVLTIEPFSGTVPPGAFQAHDAHEVINRLASKIVRPKKPSG